MPEDKPHLRAVTPRPLQKETSVYKYDLEDGTYIIMLDGTRPGRQVPLIKKRLTIGRDPEADIVLDDQDVSSQHAEIARDGGTFILRDTGSRNGVEYRGQIIDEVPLANGDEFSICRNRFKFVTKAGGPATFDDDEENTAVDKAPTRPSGGLNKMVVAAVLVLILGGAAAWAIVTRGGAPKVYVVPVQSGPLQQTTSLTGRLVPRSEVRVFASVSAPVVELLVKEGQPVNKGDPLLALDPEMLGMARDKAKAEVSAAVAAVRSADEGLRRAERKLREDRALARKGILSRAEVDAAMAAVNTRRADKSNALAKQRLAETRLAQARRDHQDTVVTAPIGGVVTTLNIKVGEAPHDLRGMPVATIEDASEVLAEISAGGSKVGLLRPGQRASIRVSGAGFGTDFAGRVLQIAPKAQAPSSSGGATIYSGKVALDQQDARLRPGMQVQVKITTAEKALATTVPLSAVVTGGRSETGMAEQVAVVEGSTVRWVPIQTDLVSTDRVEIVSGPKPGALVIAGPVDVLLELKEGDLVNPQAE